MSGNEVKDDLSILKEIFYFSAKNPLEIYPIVQKSDNICKLKSYMENKNIDNKNKLSILKKIKNLFLINHNLIPFFTKKYKTNSSTFFSPIIDLFLSEDIKEKDLSFLEEFLILLNSNISISKLSLEFIYQKFSKYYRNKGKTRLTESLLIRYLHLLQIFYKDNSIIENNVEEEISTQEEKKLRNYIYLNGYGSGILFNLNYNSTNCKTLFPSLENGCSFFFWINLNDELLKIYRNIYPNIEINLIKINIGGKQIMLLLKETKYLQIKIEEAKSNNIDLSSVFQFNKWNKICFIIGKAEKNSSIKLYINSARIPSNITIPKNFPIKEKIDEIKCFSNLIGKVSSLLFFSFPLEDKLITYFSIKLKHGFYKNKILYRFLHSNNKEYLNNAINYKYTEKFKNDYLLNKEFKILSDEKNSKNIISFFCPFSYNKSKNEIDDIFGNYLGLLSEDDGVNVYINYIKNIKQAGGMNVLLPIAEIMFSSNIVNQNISYNLIDKNILSENTLYEYLIIIKNLLINHTKNLYDANKSKFFSSLGLFLEKFPAKIFTEKILEVLIDIGKEIFQTEFDYNSSKNDNYINMILLNEKIFSKFSEENQRKLWDKVYQFFTSDYSQMKDSLNISKICLLLRFYDEKRYNEYCCKEHAEIFSKSKNNQNNLNLNLIEKEDKIKIMNPEMGKKIDKLFDTIQIYINKLDSDKETINLYKLLSLDISPCLQSKIIQVYIYHFKSENIPKSKKDTTFRNLMENDYIEITEYVLSVSLLDIRIQILSLFKIIISDYYNNLLEYLSISPNEKNLYDKRIGTIFNFIGENLLPDKLLVEIDCIKPKDDKDQDLIQNYDINNDNIYLKKRANTEKNIKLKLNNFKVLSEESMILTSSKNLVKYFNKNIYDSQINSLYKFFIEWLQIKIAKEKKIVSFVIDFLIVLVSKISPDYIDNFSNYLFSCFNRNDILNKNSLYENLNIYPWLIETIFYFHNSENNKKTIENSTIAKIQEQTIDLFTEIFSSKRPQNEFKLKIKYILDYSYYLKFIYGTNENKKNEISNITRVLLEKILSCSGGNINIKTEICFEYLVFYKNSEKLFNIDYDINEKAKRSISCLFSSSELNNLNQDNNNVLNKEELKDNIINENNININSIDDEKDDDNPLLMAKTEINDSIFEKKKDLLPKYLLEGLNYYDQIDNSNNNNNQVKTLVEVWKDFSIYDNIIDNYHSKIWGIENICSKVDIEYNGLFLEVCKLLLEQYGISNSKKNKNILMEEIIKLLNLSSESETENIEETDISNKEKEKDKDKNQKNIHNNFKRDFTKNNDDLINILNINLILLCISIEITKDHEQKEFLEKQYQQFLIFCILASINISTSVKNHDLIQDILYNVLGFGCLFLKEKDELKYKEIITYLIEPILKEINDDFKKGGFRTMFGMQKKLLYRNTAVFRLFASISLDDKEIDNKKEKEKDNIKSESAKKRSARLTTSDKITVSKRLNYNFEGEEIDAFTTAAKKGEHKNRVLLEFQGNENQNKFINELFDKTLEKYKIFRENSENRAKIKNYYEINKTNNDIDLDVYQEKNIVKEKIKELIPSVETQIKQYSNTSFLQEKKRRNKYKRMKKRLFSWRGFWSDRYLFFKHPEYLKIKIKNHFTKEMIKPLFSPVLDINYYMPKFSKFDKNNLFNKNNYDYNINLDIDEILGDDNSNSKNISDIYKNNIEENNEIININNKSQERISIGKYYNNKSRNIHGIRNNYGFNYLESLYKLNYEGIWELYNSYNEQRISIDKKEKNKNDINDNLQSQLTLDLKNKNSLNLSTLEKKLTSNLTLGCCIVKPTHHIKGNIIIKKNYFQFLFEDNSNKSLEMIQEEIENDPNFDKDMGCCYGSIFKNYKKDKDNTAFFLEYSKIKYMFIRVYFYKESGLEIYTKTNKSYFLNFKTKEDMHMLLNEIISNFSFREIKTEAKRIIGYEQIINVTGKKKSYNVINKMEEWQNYMISTLDYLMWLNIYSGRSFNDLTQYPVIPWIISNYNLPELHYKSDHRDLSLPMGMLEFECFDKSLVRKESYIEIYDSLKNDFKQSNPDFNFEAYLQKGEEYFENYRTKKIKNKKKDEKKNNENITDMGDDFCSIQINQIPYYFGSHYSNPTYVSHYLTRIFPYSFIAIEIQGDKFDDPDRMFISMKKTFESACTLKDDVRELIPEFYILPGIFKNNNNLNLSQGKLDSEGRKLNINDVQLPPWSKNKSTSFVSEMRKFLENHDDKINKWIDLIFGSYQRGEKAEEAHNLFMAQTYEKMIKIEEISDPDYRNTLMRLIEIGVTPYKIFLNDSKARLDKNSFFQKSPLYSFSKGNFLYECKNLETITLKTKNYKKIVLNNFKNEKKNNNEIQENKVYPKIISIKSIDYETLKIFLNTNHWYDINFSINDKDAISFDSEIHSFQNNSSKYASTYQIASLNNNPFVVYGKSKYVIKGGFWDGRLEFNSFPTEAKEQPISTCIFSKYGKPIVVMEMSEDEKYLICGTISGLIYIYEINGEKINNTDNNIFLHNDEITSISINNNLNMFASVSKDGYLLLYIMPSFNLVRAIRLSTKVKSNEKDDKVYENNNEKKEKEKEIQKDQEKKEELNKVEKKENLNEGKNEIIEDKKEDNNQKIIKEVKNLDEIKKDDKTSDEEIKEENKEDKKEENKINNENNIEKKIEEGKEKKEEEKEKKEEKEETKEKKEAKEKDEENKKEKEKAIQKENETPKKLEEKRGETKENNEKELANKNIDSNNENKINEINDIKNLNINEENDESEEEEQLYADNVFLSSSPLPCVTVYISQKRIFRTYTINGEFVGEEKEKDDEDSKFIKSPIIFKNLYFQDFLIYGTDKGYVKIRAFPKMNIIGIVRASLNSIETLEISKDKRYCYVWSKGNEINIIKDISVSSIQVSENISRMGFNIGK